MSDCQPESRFKFSRSALRLRGGTCRQPPRRLRTGSVPVPAPGCVPPPRAGHSRPDSVAALRLEWSLSDHAAAAATARSPLPSRPDHGEPARGGAAEAQLGNLTLRAWARGPQSMATWPESKSPRRPWPYAGRSGGDHHGDPAPHRDRLTGRQRPVPEAHWPGRACQCSRPPRPGLSVSEATGSGPSCRYPWHDYWARFSLRLSSEPGVLAWIQLGKFCQCHDSEVQVLTRTEGSPRSPGPSSPRPVLRSRPKKTIQYLYERWHQLQWRFLLPKSSYLSKIMKINSWKIAVDGGVRCYWFQSKRKNSKSATMTLNFLVSYTHIIMCIWQSSSEFQSALANWNRNPHIRLPMSVRKPLLPANLSSEQTLTCSRPGWTSNRLRCGRAARHSKCTALYSKSRIREFTSLPQLKTICRKSSVCAK